MPCFARNSGERPRGAGPEAFRPVQFAGLGVPVESEQVAAQAVLHGFDDGEHGVGGDGGVDGRAAARQNLRRRLRGERLAGGCDSLLRDHLRAAVIAALSGQRTPAGSTGSRQSSRWISCGVVYHLHRKVVWRCAYAEGVADQLCATMRSTIPGDPRRPRCPQYKENIAWPSHGQLLLNPLSRKLTAVRGGQLLARRQRRPTLVFDAVAHQKEIAQVAYRIWLERADRPGSPEEDWLKAEAEVRAKYAR